MTALMRNRKMKKVKALGNGKVALNCIDPNNNINNNNNNNNNNLTPWLMEPGGSMPHSQGLSNNSYPEPNQPNYPH